MGCRRVCGFDPWVLGFKTLDWFSRRAGIDILLRWLSDVQVFVFIPKEVVSDCRVSCGMRDTSPWPHDRDEQKSINSKVMDVPI